MKSDILMIKSIVDIQKEEQFNEFLTKLKTDVTFRVLKIEFNNLNHKELTKAEEFVSSIVDETHNYNTVIEILARCLITAVRNFKEKE